MDNKTIDISYTKGMKEQGRPTLLDEDLFRKIKALYTEGKNLREVSEILELSYATVRDWQYENYQGFADKLIEWRLMRMFDKSISNIEVLQESEDERVNLQANTLVAETVGKKWFSKRVEQTGADGKDLPVPIIQINRDAEPSK